MTRRATVWFVMTVSFLLLLWLSLFTGTVDIPLADSFEVLTGGEASKPVWKFIILELRVPMAITAALTGASLSIAGLFLQTTFNNPLAGPSILGVSTGASLGVAVAVLACAGVFDATSASIVGALVGAAIVIIILLGFSSLVRSGLMLLIVGIMISYLTSSVISWLNFYATQEGVHSYVVWGLGNFSSVGLDSLGLYSLVNILLLLFSFLMVKPLNAFLLGERYAANIGTNVMRNRNLILIMSGVLIAVTTAFCGPIGFIGLAVPHIVRLGWKTSNHKILIPATILTGAVTGLLTLCLSLLPGDRGMLPVNAVTPLIGVPVVFYIILNRKKISYFN